MEVNSRTPTDYKASNSLWKSASTAMFCYMCLFFKAKFILDCILLSSQKRNEHTHYLCRKKKKQPKTSNQPKPTNTPLDLPLWSTKISCGILSHYSLTGKIIHISDLRKNQLNPCCWFSISCRTVENFYRVGRQLMLQYLKMLTETTQLFIGLPEYWSWTK